MYPKLEDCTLLTGSQYLDLVDPEFIAQTRADQDGVYHMVFLSEGTYYKTRNTL